MEFSCHIWAFDNLPLQEALGTIARLGFRYVDIGTGAHFNPTRALDNAERKAMFREFRDALDLYNLQVADMYLFLPRISLNDDNKRSRDMLLFKALLPFAKAFGANGVTVTSGLLHPENDDEAWQRTISALREMYSIAHEAGLPLSVEPHIESMVYTVKHIQRLLAAVDELQLTLDWAQLVSQGIKEQALVDLLPDTRHVQMRQAKKSKLQVPFADGTINAASVVSALQTANYTGFVSVEYMQGKAAQGIMEVNPIVESAKMRDALREARDSSRR
jgi:sugar phosphate isomerase/epimerase